MALTLKQVGLWLLLSGLVVGAAIAGRIDQVQVDRDGKQYQLAISSYLDVPVADLRALLTDYPEVAKANSAVESLEVISAKPAGATRIRATLKVCIWFYCRSLKQTQDMLLLSPGHLEATIVPAESDFQYGKADWLMRGERDGSRLLFTAKLTPDFWVPPLIGPYVIKKKMRKEAIETVQGIERLVLQQIKQ